MLNLVTNVATLLSTGAVTAPTPSSPRSAGRSWATKKRTTHTARRAKRRDATRARRVTRQRAH